MTKLDFSNYNRFVLVIYTVLGLPGLPMAILMLLIRRYAMGNTNLFKPENRVELIVDYCTSSFVFTVMPAIIFAILYFTGSFR